MEDFLKTQLLPRVAMYCEGRIDDGKATYGAKKEGPPPDALLQRHMLRGDDYFLGVSPCLKNGKTSFLTIDIDQKGDDEAARVANENAIRGVLMDKSIPFSTFVSGGGKGRHIFILLSEPVPTIYAAGVLERIVHKAGVELKKGVCEIFPHAPGVEINIAMPFGRKSVAVEIDARAYDLLKMEHDRDEDIVALWNSHVEVKDGKIGYYGRAFPAPLVKSDLELLSKASIIFPSDDFSHICAVTFDSHKRPDSAFAKAKEIYGDGLIIPRDFKSSPTYKGFSLPMVVEKGELKYGKPAKVEPRKKAKPGPKAADIDYDAAFDCAATQYEVDAYDSWIGLASAGKAAFGDDPDRLAWFKERWLQWSAQSSSHRPVEDAKDFDNLKPKKSTIYGFWTVARKGGYKGKSPYSKKDEEKVDLLAEILGEGELFRGKDGNVYVDLGTRRVLKIDGPDFYDHLRRKLLPKIVSSDAIKNVTDTVKATVTGEEQDVNLRFARHGDKSYLFLADADNHVIEIDRSGYRLCESPPVRFVKLGSTLPLPMPDENGTLDMFADHFNFGSNEDARLFLLAWAVKLVTQPNSVTPGLLFQGEKGSAKSTAMWNLTMLLDPRKAILTGPPKDELDLIVSAMNSAIVTFDNVTVLFQVIDAMTRLVSGSGLKTRALYTNGDMYMLEVMRPILFTCIEASLSKSDIIERFVMIDLERRKTFKEDDVVKAEYLAARPMLLHALLNLCVDAMGEIEYVPDVTSSRCAAFARVGEAVSRVMGNKAGEFIASYDEQMEAAQEEAATGDPAFDLMVKEMHNYRAQGMTDVLLDPVELLTRFRKIHYAENLSGKLPDRPHGLKVKFAYMGDTLAKATGYRLERRFGDDRRKRWYAVAMKPAELSAPAWAGTDLSDHDESAALHAEFTADREARRAGRR